MKKTIHYLSTILIAVIALLGVSYIQAWSGPTLPPPNGNTPAPLNVGLDHQIKLGGISVASLISRGGAVFESGVKITTGAGRGKVFVSDSDGNGSWEENTLSVEKMCAITEVDKAKKNTTYSISLLDSNSSNVCTGSSGCSYHLWYKKDDKTLFQSWRLYGSTNYYYIQEPGTGKWVDDKGGQVGINGTGYEATFVNTGYPGVLRDDSDLEQSQDEWSWTADRNNEHIKIIVCPSM